MLATVRLISDWSASVLAGNEREARTARYHNRATGTVALQS